MSDKTKKQLIGAGILVVIVVILAFSCGRKEEKTATNETATTTQASNTTGRYTIVSDSYFGCGSKADFETMVTYVSQGDKAAFSSAYTLGLAAGTVTLFKKGEVVYLMDATWTGGVQVRREGETATYWTVTEAIGR